MHSMKFLKRYFPLLAFTQLHLCPPDEGGGTTDEGDTTDDAGNKGGKKIEEKVETVSQAEYNRMVAEADKHKKEAATLKREKSERETQKLKEANDWKALAEAKEKEAEELRAENKRTQTAFVSEKKFSAVKSAAEKLGLRAEALSDLEMLDLDPIVHETTSTGKLNILGADKFAERLKSTKPHWFADKTKPVVNGGGQRVLDTDDAVTLKDVQDAEKASRKSGDTSEYHKLHKKYQQQRAQAR